MRSNRTISKNISYTEATKSATAIKRGIDNTPDSIALANMRYIAEKVFQPVRGRFCVPIAITSFYRSPALNRAIGGSSTSQHCKGEAMDLDADVYGVITNRYIFNYIKDNLEFDQLIWEFGDDKEPAWVHVSLKKNGVNRKQILQAYKEKDWRGRYITKYKNYEG
jgi:zinc D-Ala-D-Ala carboxypeptidase